MVAGFTTAVTYALRTGKLKNASGIIYLTFVIWIVTFYMIVPAIKHLKTGNDNLWESFIDPGPTMAVLFTAGLYSGFFGLICWLIRTIYRKFKRVK